MYAQMSGWQRRKDVEDVNVDVVKRKSNKKKDLTKEIERKKHGAMKHPQKGGAERREEYLDDISILSVCVFVSVGKIGVVSCHVSTREGNGIVYG